MPKFAQAIEWRVTERNQEKVFSTVELDRASIQGQLSSNYASTAIFVFWKYPRSSKLWTPQISL
jgi:hypothetical protein